MSLQRAMYISVLFALLVSSTLQVWGEDDYLSFPAFPNYDSWKLSNSKRVGDTETIEWVKKAETVDRWTKMISAQKFRVNKKKGKWSSPQVALEIFRQDTQPRCPNVTWNVIEDSHLSVLYEFKIEGCSQIEDRHEVSKLVIGPFTLFRLAYVEKVKELAPEVRNEWLALLRNTKIGIRK